MSYELPDYLHCQVANTITADQITAERQQLWAVVLNLVPKQDGNQWCVLHGENLQDGIAAFGDTPQDAMYHFDEAFKSTTGSKS